VTASSELLERLRAFRTPTVYDALERFDLRPRNEGYTDLSVRAVVDGGAPVVGYAWTGKIVGTAPAESGETPGETNLDWGEVWAHVGALPGPRIAVIEDCDPVPGRGCVWGDVSVSIFQALGTVGGITNGSVRDAPELRQMGIHLIAAGLTVGHAYVRFAEVGTPVTVAGLAVEEGDLIHADEHGAMTIPPGVDLEELIAVAGHVLEAEEKVKGFVTSPDFDLAALDALHSWSMESDG